jgi:quinol-cytochrome oxidoreductase complex cytochrome b subunit
VPSWIYVFGVATLAALLVVLASGLVPTLKGATWWHTSSVGHFFNSMHLWSVELFFACMVIHLWGKFFMAAWRGKRALTWITGAVAFVGSIGTAFTGYLTQSKFDSQWISTQAKDGLNAVGIGAYFNVLDPGQMLLWHVMLLPLVVGVLVVWHVILVRRHGVVPPFDAVPPEPAGASAAEPAEPEAAGSRPGEPAGVTGCIVSGSTGRRRRRDATPDAHLFPTRPYDLVKEFVVALVIIGLLTVALAAVSSRTAR